MNYCFPCFSSHKSKKEPESGDNHEQKDPNPGPEVNNNVVVDHANIKSQNFTFRDLATATKNFRQECLLGEGGFGRVYKGTLKDSGQVVAVKQLDRNGLQGNKEFLVEVFMLSLLHHENLVNLIGYCADGDQRLLVYEFMPGGSVEDRLIDLGPNDKPLNWSTRMKIAYGAAKGLEYLHVEANPPVIYRDLKSSNILLDNDFNPKLSDFGLAKLGASSGGKTHVSSRVMGTYGYCAPEYARTGDLTVKSDVYSFGVVLLELITGRPAIDNTKPADEQNLVSWAQPKFRNPKLFPSMADPLLKGKFREKDLNQAVAIAAMCLQEEACVRPLMSDIVDTLGFMASVREQDIPALAQDSIKPRDEEEHNNVGENVQNRYGAGKQDVKHVSFENLESDKHEFSEGSDSDDKDVRKHHGKELSDNEDGDDSEHPDEIDIDDEDADRFGDGEDEDGDDDMDQRALLEGKAFESSSSSGSSISSHGNGSWRGKDSSKGGSINSSRRISKRFSEESVSSTGHSRKSSQKGSNNSRLDSSRSGSKKGSISLERKTSAVSMANGSISCSDRSRSGSNKGSFSLEHKTSGVSIADGSEGSVSHSDSSSRSGSMKGGISLEHKASGVSVADGSEQGSISHLDISRSGSMKGGFSLEHKTSGVSVTDGSEKGSISRLDSSRSGSMKGSISLERKTSGW